ncbi:MAG: cytochrome c3 family protein, partial [bacterium]|nr:cytochrome c3 family protein [bacterium]
HPGGGSLEYDRDGYRYDGINGGLGFTGLNPAPGNGDYSVFSAGKFSNKFGASAKGVVEADCMLCHYGERYNNVNRNFCMSKPGNGLKGTSFANAASFGLTGTATAPGEVLTTQLPAQGVNPSCDIVGYADGVIEADKILVSPIKENCANCHFADGGWLEPGPASSGTTNTPLGFTTFQKIIPPDTFTDTDTGALNTKTYLITKGKAEFGKRSESINIGHNPDVHMDKGMNCVDCHYLVSGDFPALTDELGNAVQGPRSVLRIDHQIAKGNNVPDGKNMDDLDNTVTCEMCHVDWTHPNLIPCASASGYCMDVNHDGVIDPLNEDVPDPGMTAHVDFPALHFKKIDCRTCHIPEQNFKKKQTVADYSSTPYPQEDEVSTGGEQTGIGRAQAVSNKTGIHYEPLYMYRCREHGCLPEEMQILPVTTTMVPVWKDASTGLPYNKRFPKTAAQKLRQVMSGTLTAPFSWTLNSPQGGDKALIINTSTELQNMVTILQGGIPAGAPAGFAPMGAAGQIAEPALNLFVNTFNTSHNTVSSDPDGVGPIPPALGSADSNGCRDCHSPDSTFFVRDHELFKQPLDGGLQMSYDATNRPLILGTLNFPCPDGTTSKVDLTAGRLEGEPISNVIPQKDALCLTAAEATALEDLLYPPDGELGMAHISMYENVGTVCTDCHNGSFLPAAPNIQKMYKVRMGGRHDCVRCHNDDKAPLLFISLMNTLEPVYGRCSDCHQVKHEKRKKPKKSQS